MAANVEELFQIKNRILGVLIQEARQASGQTQADCADLLGVPIDTYIGYETGTLSPSLPQLELLSFAFNLPIKHFWGADTLASKRRHDEIKERVPELVMLRQKMIGLKVFELREKAGMTREQVSEKTAMSPDKIEQIELGRI